MGRLDATVIRQGFDNLGRYTVRDYPSVRLKLALAMALLGIFGLVILHGGWIVLAALVLVAALAFLLDLPARECVFYLNSHVVKLSEKKLFYTRSRKIVFDDIRRIRIDGGFRSYWQMANIVFDVDGESIPVTCADDQRFAVEEVLATIKSIVRTD